MSLKNVKPDDTVFCKSIADRPGKFFKVIKNDGAWIEISGGRLFRVSDGCGLASRIWISEEAYQQEIAENVAPQEGDRHARQ